MKCERKIESRKNVRYVSEAEVRAARSDSRADLPVARIELHLILGSRHFAGAHLPHIGAARLAAAWGPGVS